MDKVQELANLVKFQDVVIQGLRHDIKEARIKVAELIDENQELSLSNRILTARVI